MAVAVTGFPEGRQPQKRPWQSLIWQNFYRKLHEN